MEGKSRGICDSPWKLSFKLIQKITNCFSEDRKLGHGSFGQVYKGVFEDGEEIAVKMLPFMIESQQFENEFGILKSINHRNIVRLVGLCNETEETVAPFEGKLVRCDKIHRAICLEYMPNGSLGKLLAGGYLGTNWPLRYRIIKGICEGLKYLHEGLEAPIFHLDLKPDNILLDQDMNPKIADFGLSRLIGEENTRKTATQLGTLGYLPPEFINCGIISKEYDIYSLGVIITKIIAGILGYLSTIEMDDPDYFEHVYYNWQKILQEIPKHASVESHCMQVRRCIEIAVNCIDKDRRKRPKMKEILCKLDEIENKVPDTGRQIEKDISWVMLSMGSQTKTQQNSGNIQVIPNNDLPIPEPGFSSQVRSQAQSSVIPLMSQQLTQQPNTLEASSVLSVQKQLLGIGPHVSNIQWMHMQQQTKAEVQQPQLAQQQWMVPQSQQNELQRSHQNIQLQQLFWMLQQPLLQQKLLSYASTLIPQNNVDTQMQYIQAQGGIQEASSTTSMDITAQTDHPIVCHWQQELYEVILCGHSDEVWFVKFSNNGNYLASSSSDCTAIIWKVENDDTLTKKHCLEGHQNPISFVAWSPNDKLLLTCGNRESLKLWNVDTGECNLKFSDSVHYIITACAWFPNSDKIVCASSEPGCSPNRIFTCDLEGKELEVWAGDRIPKATDLAVTPDGQHLICVCCNEIWIRELPKGREWRIHEKQTISSLSLSVDGQSLIVNLNSQEIHLWKIKGSSTIPEIFKGHKQGRFVIRSCFGGSNSMFIASGSEDSQVYIWKRDLETPIKVLRGHSMIVNSVSWNPARPHMLASASDDHTVRIWLASKIRNKHN